MAFMLDTAWIGHQIDQRLRVGSKRCDTPVPSFCILWCIALGASIRLEIRVRRARNSVRTQGCPTGRFAGVPRDAMASARDRRPTRSHSALVSRTVPCKKRISNHFQLLTSRWGIHPCCRHGNSWPTVCSYLSVRSRAVEPSKNIERSPRAVVGGNRLRVAMIHQELVLAYVFTPIAG